MEIPLPAARGAVLVFFGLITASTACLADAQVYTWVDQAGTVHFSQAPSRQDFDLGAVRVSDEARRAPLVRGGPERPDTRVDERSSTPWPPDNREGEWYEPPPTGGGDLIIVTQAPRLRPAWFDPQDPEHQLDGERHRKKRRRRGSGYHSNRNEGHRTQRLRGGVRGIASTAVHEGRRAHRIRSEVSSGHPGIRARRVEQQRAIRARHAMRSPGVIASPQHSRRSGGRFAAGNVARASRGGFAAGNVGRASGGGRGHGRGRGR